MVRRIAYGVLGAVTVFAGVLALRAQRDPDLQDPRVVPPGETTPAEIRVERLRELGI